jgi:hypothetical protein
VNAVPRKGRPTLLNARRAQDDAKRPPSCSRSKVHARCLVDMEWIDKAKLTSDVNLQVRLLTSAFRVARVSVRR